MINYLEEEVERLFQQNEQLRAQLLNETYKRQVVENIIRKSKEIEQQKKAKRDKRKNAIKEETRETVCEEKFHTIM